jgi:hypothetical protein
VELHRVRRPGRRHGAATTPWMFATGEGHRRQPARHPALHGVPFARVGVGRRAARGTGGSPRGTRTCAVCPSPRRPSPR